MIDENLQKNTFLPTYVKEVSKFNDQNGVLVHYTDADSLSSIIETNQFWLSKVSNMNDTEEIKHGIKLINDALNNPNYNRSIKKVINEVSHGLFEQLLLDFETIKDKIVDSVFIASLSVHNSEKPKENKYGRLSMWRAYSSSKPVAICMNKQPFFGESAAMKAFTSPVVYTDENDSSTLFKDLVESLSTYNNFAKSIDTDSLRRILLGIAVSGACCLKHIGFEEEKEWRIVYLPTVFGPSEHIETKTVTIAGEKKLVSKMPLKDIPDIGFFGANIPSLIEKVIIGPANNQVSVRDQVVGALLQAGVENPDTKVVYSGIPLRT